MKTGIIDSDINDLWCVVHDSGELAAATTTYTISGLSGDTDLEYKLIVRGVGGSSISFNLRFNGDSGSNYGWQVITGVSTTAAAARSTSATSIPITWGTLASGELFLADIHIFSKSGKERTTLHNNADRITGTTVTNLAKFAGVWSNTADEITSVSVVASNTNGIAIGSRVILLRKVHATDAMKTGELTPTQVTGAWERIYSNTVSSAAATIDISSLTGNTDVIYRLVLKGISATNASIRVRMNSNSGSVYGYQRVRGSSTTVAAASGATTSMIGHDCSTAGYTGLVDKLIYAKSGYERTILSTSTGNVTGTTVGNLYIYGESYNDTSTEITSINIISTSGTNIAVGTVIELYRLNL